jgi:glucose/arabinose dehydrogenase
MASQAVREHPKRIMRRFEGPFAAFLLVLLATPAGAAIVPTSFVDEIVTTGFDLPRAFAFLPDGRALVLEQHTGDIRMVVGGHIASTDPITTLAGLDASGSEAGAQGIAIDPQWPARPYVYVFYGAFTNRHVLVRLTGSGGLTNPTGESLTLSTPMTLIGDIVNGAPNHNAGCLRFGADGYLYVSLGEDGSDCEAQDSTSLRGQILRLRTDALPAGNFGGAQVPRGLLLTASNPLSTPDSNAMLVWAYGLRNPWTFDIDRTTGKLYVADVGETSEEEIDEVVAGANYGWPYREGKNTVIAHPECPEPGGTGNPANGYRAPIAAYDHGVGAQAVFTTGLYRPSAGGSANWPSEYNGALFYGNYYDGAVKRIAYSATSGTWDPAPTVPGQPGSSWATGMTYAADFAVAADGSLWWLQQSSTGGFTPTDGALRRIRYTGSSNVPPSNPSGVSLAAGPNPFAGSTTLMLSLPVTGFVRLTIHDLAGREIVRLLNGTAPAGPVQVSWDGRDARGRPVHGGVYVARVETPAGHASTRLMRAP